MKTWRAFRLYAAQEFAEIFAEQTYGDASGCKRAQKRGGGRRGRFSLFGVGMDASLMEYKIET